MFVVPSGHMIMQMHMLTAFMDMLAVPGKSFYWCYSLQITSHMSGWAVLIVQTPSGDISQFFEPRSSIQPCNPAMQRSLKKAKKQEGIAGVVM